MNKFEYLNDFFKTYKTLCYSKLLVTGKKRMIDISIVDAGLSDWYLDSRCRLPDWYLDCGCRLPD